MSTPDIAIPILRGLPRMDTIEDRPWGMREFVIVDEDGNLLRIGQALSPFS